MWILACTKPEKARSLVSEFLELPSYCAPNVEKADYRVLGWNQIPFSFWWPLADSAVVPDFVRTVLTGGDGKASVLPDLETTLVVGVEQLLDTDD
jgi:hypothetical protein